MVKIIAMSLKFFMQIMRLIRKEHRRRTPLPMEVWDSLWREQAREFRQIALQLEGMLIKLGQFLSTRADLLPQVYTLELEQLQDQITPVSFRNIQKELMRSYGFDLELYFKDIESTPLAAASLGQVHKGTLPTGELVAIKVQRPHIDRLIRADLMAIHIVIYFLHKFSVIHEHIDLRAIYEEVERTTLEELDYRVEASYLTEFQANFKKRPGIKIPKLYEHLTRPHVLVMEYLEGGKVNDLTFMREHQLVPRQIAQQYLEFFLYQVMKDGLFHADPHPGNVWITPTGNLIFLDFGMMGRIDQRNRDGLRHFLLAIIEEDAKHMLESLREMGVIIFPGVDVQRLLQSLSALMAPYFDQQSMTQVSNEMIQGILVALQAFVYEQPLQLPYHLTFLGRAASIVAGISTEIEPAVPYLSILHPFLTIHHTKSDEKQTDSDTEEHRSSWRNVLQTIGLMDWIRAFYRIWNPFRRLTGAVISTFEQLSTGHFRFERIHDHTILRTFHRLTNRIAWFAGVGYFSISSWSAFGQRKNKEAAIAGGVALAFLIAALHNTRKTEQLFRRDVHNRK